MDLEDVINERYHGGKHEANPLRFPWDLRTYRNEKCPSGVYIVSVKINNEKAILKKIMIIR